MELLGLALSLEEACLSINLIYEIERWRDMRQTEK